MSCAAVPEGLIGTLRAAATAVEGALARQTEWGLTGKGDNQYHHDTAADAAAIAVLDGAGLAVFSEESGLHHPDRPVMVVLDPVDGSTNASRGIPWWAISLCAVDAEGPLAGLVACPALGQRFEAVRGGGATCNGTAISPSGLTELSQAIVAFNGYPPAHHGWGQFRALGAAALDLCAVASGVVDGFVDFSTGGLAPWDYMAGILICQEAGAVVRDVASRELVIRQPGERRVLVAAGTDALLDRLMGARGADLNS